MMEEQLCEYTKIEHFKVNFMTYEICIHKVVKCKKNKTKLRDKRPRKSKQKSRKNEENL